MRHSYLLLLLLLTVAACTKNERASEDTYRDQTRIDYEIRTVLPHDPAAFTQGLVIYNGKVYESTGQENSWIAEVEIGSGKHDKKIILDREYFGEGITILNDKIYQLTWTSKKGFVYDLKTFKKIKEFTYNTEGWGLTHNNEHLIMSDGTDKLYFLDTTSLEKVKTIAVKDQYNNRVKNLNELEFIEGYIFANVWESSVIVKIDPSTGIVVGTIDLSPITNEIKSQYPQADVLNGIAYDEASRSLLVTGKWWPKTYVIKLRNNVN